MVQALRFLESPIRDTQSIERSLYFAAVAANLRLAGFKAVSILLSGCANTSSLALLKTQRPMAHSCLRAGLIQSPTVSAILQYVTPALQGMNEDPFHFDGAGANGG